MAINKQQARDKLRDALQSIADPDSRVRVTINADGTVDAEILKPVPHGSTFEEIVTDWEAALLNWGNLPRGTFASVGFRWEPRSSDPENLYDRYRGLFQIFSNYYFVVDLPHAVAVSIDIADGMRPKRYHRPSQAVLRLHWNRHNDRPRRDAK